MVAIACKLEDATFITLCCICPVRLLEARPLSESIMNSKHAYSDSFLRKILARNKVIVSVGVSLNAIRPSYFVARYLSRRGYTIIPVNPGI